MKSEKKVRTYFGMIMTSMVFITLLMVILLSLFSWKASSVIFRDAENRIVRQNENNCFDQIGNYLATDQYYVLELISSKEVRSYIEEESEDDAILISAASDVRQKMQEEVKNSQASNESAIGSLSIFMKDGRTVSSDEGIIENYTDYLDCDQAASRFFRGYQDGYIPFLWIDRVSVTLKGVRTDCLIGISFLYKSGTLERIGAVLISVPVRGIQERIKGLTEEGMIVRNDGKVLVSTGKINPGDFYDDAADMISFVNNSLSESLLYEGHKYRLRRLPGGALWFLMDSETALPDEQSYQREYIRRVLAMSVFAVIVTILLSLMLSRSITVSVEQLSKVARQIEAGNLSARFVSKRKDEVAVLGQSFNRMLDRIEAFYHTEEKNAAARSDLELKLLRAQINPHLLYNTLNSVVWIIRQGDTKKAEALVLSMGSFFKLALSKGNDEIALFEEISMINYYLEIQNLGRGKSFRLVSDVPKDLEKVKIMRLSLQPLVENAVVHGFTDWRDDGKILISASADEDNNIISICIEDNGIGILPEDLARLSEDMECFPPKKEHKHFGLYSVHVRIRNRYGSKYGVTMESEVGEFTKMTVRLPLEKEELPND